MAAVSGFGGRVKIDDVIFKANRWTLDYVLETDDSTGTVGTPDVDFDNTFASLNHRMPIKTVYPKNIDINVSIEAFYDTNYGYFGNAGLADPLNPKKNFYLSPGRTVKLELFTAKHIVGKETAAYEFKDFLILTFNHVLEVRGVAKITFSGKCNSKDYFFPNL